MLTGLPPIVNKNSRILILGSMPGALSLKNQRYYDFKHNKFWRILFDFFDKEYSDDYADKKRLLYEGKIALWDAIAGCERQNSSLDSKIKNALPNDVRGLLRLYPDIKHVITNGRTSEKYFVKYNAGIEYTYLPSTSPANASVKDVESKWKTVLSALLKD